MTIVLGLGRRSAAFLIDACQSEFISFLQVICYLIVVVVHGLENFFGLLLPIAYQSIWF